MGHIVSCHQLTGNRHGVLGLAVKLPPDINDRGGKIGAHSATTYVFSRKTVKIQPPNTVASRHRLVLTFSDLNEFQTASLNHFMLLGLS